MAYRRTQLGRIGAQLGLFWEPDRILGTIMESHPADPTHGQRVRIFNGQGVCDIVGV